MDSSLSIALRKLKSPFWWLALAVVTVGILFTRSIGWIIFSSGVFFQPPPLNSVALVMKDHWHAREVSHNRLLYYEKVDFFRTDQVLSRAFVRTDDTEVGDQAYYEKRGYRKALSPVGDAYVTSLDPHEVTSDKVGIPMRYAIVIPQHKLRVKASDLQLLDDLVAIERRRS